MQLNVNILPQQAEINQIQIAILIYEISKKSTFEEITTIIDQWQENMQVPPFVIILGLDHYTTQRQVQVQSGIELAQSVDGFWLEIDKLSRPDKDYRKLNEIMEQCIQMVKQEREKYQTQNQIQQFDYTEENGEYSDEIKMTQFGFGDEYYTRDQLEYDPDQYVEEQYDEYEYDYNDQYDQQQDDSLLLTRQLPDMKFKMDTDIMYYNQVKPRKNKILASQQRVIDDLKQQRINRLNSQIISMDEQKLENKLKNMQKKIKITETQRHQKTLLLPKQRIKMNTMQFETHVKNKQLESEKFWSSELRKVNLEEQQPHSINQYQQIWQTAPSYIQQVNKKPQKPIKIIEVQLQKKLIKIPIYTTSVPYLLAKQAVRDYDLDSYYLDKLKVLITNEKEAYQQDQYYLTHKCVNKKVTIDLLSGDQVRAILFKKDTLNEALERVCKQYQISNQDEIQNIAKQIQIELQN